MNAFKISLEREQEIIESIANDENRIMILGWIERKLVSVAQLNVAGRPRIQHNSEISISVSEKYWGIGVGSAVMEELIKFAKENPTIKNVSLGVKATNEKAIKLYEKFGFEVVGVHKNYFNINGEYTDSLIMGLYF